MSVQGLAERLQATRTNFLETQAVNNPRNYQKVTGVLNYYLGSGLSGDNIKFIQRTNAENSNYREVEIIYMPYKGTNSVVTAATGFNCTAPNQRRKKIQTVEPELFFGDKDVLEESFIREVLEGNGAKDAELNRMFVEMMRNGRESMNAQLLSDHATNFGSNPTPGDTAEPGVNAGTYKDVQLLKSDGTVDPANFDNILNDVTDNYQQGPIGLIGLGKLRKYQHLLAVGNVNDQGVDIREILAQFGMAFFADHDAQSTLGADKILALYPGLSEVFWYNQYKGEFGMSISQTQLRGTMPDPVFPQLEWDWDLKFDDGCESDNSGQGTSGKWVLRVFLNFDVWRVNEDAFGDEYGSLNGFNGVTGYTVTQA